METLFVPDHNGFHIGDLIQCHYVKKDRVWIPTGKTQKVAAPWNENSLGDLGNGTPNTATSPSLENTPSGKTHLHDL